MNFDFSDDQKALREHVRRFLTDKCTRKVVRRVLNDDNESYAAEVWKGLIDMSLPGTAIPAVYGGVGLGHLELCVIAEELGRALAPVPFSSSIYLAAEAILIAGSEAQKKAWLPKLASGEVIGTYAAAEGLGAANAKTVMAKLDGSKLSGEKLPVPDGDVAGLAIVLVRTGAGEGGDALSLALADLSAGGVKRERIATMDPTRSTARLSFDGAPAELLGARGAGLSLQRQLQDRAAVLFAFEQIGGADAALEMATQYAKDRIAFGRPIGSFQAIKHKLAEIYMRNTIARSHAYHGAWALSTGDKELPLAAAAARAAASEAFDFAAKENNQTHGGMGFTWELDCQFFYRRARLLSLVLGPARVWKDRLVTELEKQTPLAA